jgi:hypothetical protein
VTTQEVATRSEGRGERICKYRRKNQIQYKTGSWVTPGISLSLSPGIRSLEGFKIRESGRYREHKQSVPRRRQLPDLVHNNNP